MSARAIGSALMATAAALTGCSSSAPPPLPAAQQIHVQLLDLQPADAQACLTVALREAGAVAGILPATQVVAWEEGARIEQWFIAPLTHQRTVFDLRPGPAADLRREVSEVGEGKQRKQRKQRKQDKQDSLGSKTGTEVRVYLLQQQSQYRVGGWANAALRAVARCNGAG